ncbi:MAG: hypothetical protein R2788_02340 [Saprospiraceae bacterium]
MSVNGRSATCSTTVTEPLPVTASCTGSALTCNGDNSNGTASATAGSGTPGYTYAWSTRETAATETDLLPAPTRSP